MFAAVRMCGNVHLMCPLQDLQVTPFHRFAHVSLGRIGGGGIIVTVCLHQAACILTPSLFVFTGAQVGSICIYVHVCNKPHANPCVIIWRVPGLFVRMQFGNCVYV